MKPRRWIALAALLILIAGGAAGWRTWSRTVTPLAPRGGLWFPAKLLLPAPHFLQADPRWGHHPLAQTSGTLAAEGCAVAAAAMVLGSYGVAVDPGTLNRFLALNGGFTERGWLIWEAADRYAPGRSRFAYEGDPSLRLIDLNLLRRNPVIVRVRMRSGITHFLVVVGKTGFDYLVLDPASDRGPYPLREFGSPIEALRFYEPISDRKTGSRPTPDPVQAQRMETQDLIIVGGTPSGLMAGIAAARQGRTAVVLERTAHLGGLPANGLGATDISTRACTGGLFLEFIRRIRNHYVTTYGPDSPQVRDCSDGYRFEPHVAERVLEEMVAAEAPRLTVLRHRQFDATPENVTLRDGQITGIRVTRRDTGAAEHWEGRIFVDATYEGDLAAAAGAPFRTHRESASDFDEPCAGVVYKPWGGPPAEGSTGAGDNALQAYNYRLCLTDNPDLRLPIPKPEGYRRDEYVSLIEDLRLGRRAGTPGNELELDGIGWVVNMVRTPNGKTDSNNQHLAFLSTDLPEENWPWPIADWDWRDRFARRLRDYTLGLLWFVQNDPELPADFRERCSRWGLASDEYTDNGHFPRQVYVREGRRIEGRYLFTAHDSLPTTPGGRPPVHIDSITASHYPVDSHAVRKREPGRAHLDGFLSVGNKPYTVPYGVILPLEVEGLLTPVPVSATHLGFGTLRMEPCWMALGEAAGLAAHLAIARNESPADLPAAALQEALLAQGAVLIYFDDVVPDHPLHPAVQWLGLHGVLPEWSFRPDEPVSATDAERWALATGVHPSETLAEGLTRGDLARALHAARPRP